MYTETDSVLIFTRTEHRARRLARQLESNKYTVTSLHGDRSQRQRDEAIKGFSVGRYNIMVTTDIAARGLDIENISHVINYDMPATLDDYIHRIGRTGRACRTGDAFTLTTYSDEDMIRKLEKIIAGKITRNTLGDFDYSEPKPESVRRGPGGGQSCGSNRQWAYR